MPLATIEDADPGLSTDQPTRPATLTGGGASSSLSGPGGTPRGMDLASTGRGTEVEVVAPTHCVNGHQLHPPNVAVFTPGAAGDILWRCRTCNVVTQQDGTEWIDPKAGHGSLYG